MNTTTIGVALSLFAIVFSLGSITFQLKRIADILERTAPPKKGIKRKSSGAVEI